MVATHMAAPLGATSRAAARLTCASAVAFMVLLTTLHVISPEFDPAWRMVSEYALGDYGWILTLMFLSVAASCVALVFAIRSSIQTIGGKIGLGFLIASAIGMTMAAVFDWQHDLHAVASLIGVPSFPVAAMLISRDLVRSQTWSSARPLLLWTANLPWITTLLMIATVVVGLSASGGQFGPGVLVGWPNRLVLAAYAAWLIAVGWRSAQPETRPA